MRKDTIIIKKSPKHWLGVFANTAMKKWDIVIKWDISQEIPSKKIEKMSAEEKKYVCFLDEKYIQMQAPACYVNHSCEANTKAKNYCDIAIRDIEKGEEITANYNEVTSWWPTIKCNCWSSVCIWEISS